MWYAAWKDCDGGKAGADRGEMGGKGQGLTYQEQYTGGQPLVSPFLNGWRLGTAAQLSSILSTEIELVSCET